MTRLNVVDLRQSLADVLNRAEYRGEQTVIHRHGKDGRLSSPLRIFISSSDCSRSMKRRWTSLPRKPPWPNRENGSLTRNTAVVDWNRPMAKPKKRQPTKQSQPSTDAPRDDANPRSYTILLTPAAGRALDRLTRSVSCASTPRSNLCCRRSFDRQVTPGAPRGRRTLYRIRSGDFRIVYQIKDNQLLVLVVDVGDRKDVYRNL